MTTTELARLIILFSRLLFLVLMLHPPTPPQTDHGVKEDTGDNCLKEHLQKFLCKC